MGSVRGCRYVSLPSPPPVFSLVQSSNTVFWLVNRPGQNMHDENLCNIFAKLTIKHAPSSGLRPAIKLKTRERETLLRFQHGRRTIEVKLKLDRFRKAKLKVLRSLDVCQGCNDQILLYHGWIFFQEIIILLTRGFWKFLFWWQAKLAIFRKIC